MPAPFSFDVFLSHSSKDKPVVRELAQRLRADGVQVWFDEWEILPGDNIPHKIEQGLESSRVLILCMSANAFASEWATLESQTFRFRDPLNKTRRFLPLNLDGTNPKGSLAQFLYIDWQPTDHISRTDGYAKLLQATLGNPSGHTYSPTSGTASTQPPPSPNQAPSANSAQLAQRQSLETMTRSLGHSASVWSVAWSPDGKRALSGSEDDTVRLWEVETGSCLRVMEGHSAPVLSVAWSPDGKRALSGSADATVRLWEVETGSCLRVMEGHSDSVLSVAWSPDGKRALSGSEDDTVRLWEVETGSCLRVMEGHSARVLSVAWSPDGKRALSGSADDTVRLWEVETGSCLRVMEGHSAPVWSVAWSPDGKRALSGSADDTVRLWEVETGSCLRVMEGHSDSVLSVAWSPDGKRALSGSADATVRLWEVETGSCLRVMEGHSAPVLSVAWSPDGKRALSGSEDDTVRLWEVETGSCLRVMEGHSAPVLSVAWSPDGKRALSGSADATVRLWEVETGSCLRVMEGHSARVLSVAWSPDGKRALSGSADDTVRLWEVETGSCLRVMEGHSARVLSVAWSPDGKRALSGSADDTVRLWEVETGSCLRVMEGHSAPVWSVAWSPDGKRALSGSEDDTVRLWEVETGSCLRVMEGHSAPVWSVAWSPDGKRALSGSEDDTVRLWEVETGSCLRVMEGHSAPVLSVAWSPDGKRALSGSADDTVRLWEVETGLATEFEGHSGGVQSVFFVANGRRIVSAAENGVLREWNPALHYLTTTPVLGKMATVHFPFSDAVTYTNAKVLLVGDSGAGKTGLSTRLTSGQWQPSPGSTVGAWSTQIKIPVSTSNGVEREIWLWDFGGQADQRLIHQLYMDETSLAVLVFDGQKDDVFETLGQWDRDLTRSAGKPFPKLLAAGRTDVAGLRVSESEVKKFAVERGFQNRLFKTSAQAGTDCEELKQAIIDAIDWSAIPFRSSPEIFRRLKEEIITLKDEGRSLMRLNELRDSIRLRMRAEEAAFTDADLQAVVGLLAGPCVVWQLKFGSFVLLQPELINAYAQAVIQTLKDDAHERGAVKEEVVLEGNLKYHPSMKRLQPEEERFVLLAMHQTLVERGLCLRETVDGGSAMLIFPSYYRRERPDLVGHPAVHASYRFSGFLDDIYATLVVRLHHTKPFNQDQLWRYAADFRTLTNKQLGIKLTRRAEGAGELELYFDPTIPDEEKIIFSRYVHDHLLQRARDVERFRHYVCPQPECGTPVGNREVAMKRLQRWLDGNGPLSRIKGGIEAPTIICANCEKRVPLWDKLEEYFASSETRKQVRNLQEQSNLVLDNQSKERTLVGDVISTVSLAGQIARELTVADHGIDMEIEFKDDNGSATGRKLYLQLKSGDSHLRARARKYEQGGEVREKFEKVFRIDNQRHVTYWMAQAFPVMLVIRNSNGEIGWMEIREYLRQASDNGKKPVRQIEFRPERFDVMSVRRWRDRA